MIKPSKKAFMITLIVLCVILIAYGISRMVWGPILPEAVDKNLPDALIIIAVGIMLWNRKIATDEKKAEDAAREAEKLKAAEAETEGKSDGDGGQ